MAGIPIEKSWQSFSPVRRRHSSLTVGVTLKHTFIDLGYIHSNSNDFFLAFKTHFYFTGVNEIDLEKGTNKSIVNHTLTELFSVFWLEHERPLLLTLQSHGPQMTRICHLHAPRIMSP